ncbi:Arginine metabolism regulation protein II [Paramyrothecium foliicola]|nr:Arginine metabolism regulation protein II [Paramyrothecium foliicola]
MAAAGVISTTEMLRRKDKAIKSLIRCIGQKNMKSAHDTADGAQSLLLKTSSDILDMAVCASLHLIGTEITQGCDMKTFVALIRGAATLAELQLDIKLLAWHDLIGCVPYPRRPLLNRLHWYEEHHAAWKIKNRNPDVVFGFTTEIALLTGECGTFVDHLYSGRIDTAHFEIARNTLLRSLSFAVENLPDLILMDSVMYDAVKATNTKEQLNHNACIWAAVAHAMASQIYLHRNSKEQFSKFHAAPQP